MKFNDEISTQIRPAYSALFCGHSILYQSTFSPSDYFFKVFFKVHTFPVVFFLARVVSQYLEHNQYLPLRQAVLGEERWLNESFAHECTFQASECKTEDYFFSILAFFHPSEWWCKSNLSFTSNSQYQCSYGYLWTSLSLYSALSENTSIQVNCTRSLL